MRLCLPTARCLLGLDVGTVTIGVAISTPDLAIASPLLTIRRKKLKDDLAALAKIVQERQVGGFVIGLPLTLDGTIGPRAQAVQAFARSLLGAKEVLPDPPVLLWDERLSTKAVERFMMEDDMTRQRRAEKVDAAAAAWILQGALDGLRSAVDNTSS